MRELQWGEGERERGKKRWALMSVTRSCHMLKYFSTTYAVCDHSIKISWIYLKIHHPSVEQEKHLWFPLQTARYLFLISKLVVYWRLLRRLDLDLLRGRPVRGVTVGQVAHARVGELWLFMSVKQKTGRREHAAYLDLIWTLRCVSNDGVPFGFKTRG